MLRSLFWQQHQPYHHAAFWVSAAKQHRCGVVSISRQPQSPGLQGAVPALGNYSGLKFIQQNRNVAQILLPLHAATHTSAWEAPARAECSASCLPPWHSHQKTQLRTINLGKDLFSCTKTLFVARNRKGLDHILLYAIWEGGKEKKRRQEQLMAALTNRAHLHPSVASHNC